MNKSMILIMGGAIAVAVLAAVIVQVKLSGNDTGPVAAVEILVASKKLLVGEKIRPEDVRWQSWPEAALFNGAIKRSEQLDEKELFVYDTPLRRTVESGEPVTQQAVIADVKGANNFLAASIGPGMRAVGIAVKSDTSVGGFISPGDFVDVVLSYSPRMSGDMSDYAGAVVQRHASQTILSNVRVMAVDQESKDEGREAKIAKTVTLEVTKEGAEKLALASDMGNITLALRRLGEKDTALDRATSLTTDSTTSSVIAKVKEIMRRDKTTSNTVRVYSGTNIQNVPVRSADTP